jgi:hypothetical protein
MAALWFAGVALSDRRISFEGQSVPTKGARAYVEEDGDVVHRDSLARVVPPRLLSVLRGRIRPRELYLLVEGPTFHFVVPCDPSQRERARTFAANICAAGARPADAPIRRTAGPGFPREALRVAPQPRSRGAADVSRDVSTHEKV